MRIDDKQWWDSLKQVRLLDGTGYLTEQAKELMRYFEVTNLDDLLRIIEGTGRGYWYRSDLNRPDVNVSGHMAETLWGKTFRSSQGGRGSDYEK